MATDATLKSALRYMEQQEMLPAPGSLLLAAVSGGRDSMVLLDFLVTLGRERGFSVAAAHFNHHLREAADGDEVFVRSRAADYGVPCHCGGGDVAALCREAGLSVEEGARMARYAWLESLCRESGAAAVATAHHLGDQAETVLLNLVRGSGMEGLRGIAPRWGCVIRPLLATDGAEVEAYAREKNLPHVEDESNGDLRFARNRIRREVLPQLRAVNPGVESALARTAALLAEEERWLREETLRRMPPVSAAEDGVAVDYAAFAELDPVLRRRCVRLLLERLEAGKKDVSAAQLGAAAELKKGQSLTLPGGILVSAEAGALRVRMHRPAPQAVELPREGTARWGAWTFTASVEKEKPMPGENTLVFPVDKITAQVSVSCWEAGERLRTARGERSLKRLFADAGVSVGARERVPVLRCGGRCIAAIGVAADLSLAEGTGPWWVVTAREEKE